MPKPLEILDEGIFCNNCGWFEESSCLSPAPGLGTETCTGCGCGRYVHVTAKIVTEGEKA